MATEFDARGLICPLPVLKARKLLKSLPVGDTLTIVATDPGAPEDFVHFCRTTGNELVGTERQEGCARIVIRRLV
ncbi:MAG: sulfurtransferase TusA family protein [Aliidongia sp.]